MRHHMRGAPPPPHHHRALPRAVGPRGGPLGHPPGVATAVDANGNLVLAPSLAPRPSAQPRTFGKPPPPGGGTDGAGPKGMRTHPGR